MFTLLGCVIAIFATYLFPIWDSRQLKAKILNASKASLNYLEVAIQNRAERNENQSRMARKSANLSLSALSEAIESARQEPMQKHIGFKGLYDVQAIIYQINAIITSIYLSLNHKAEQTDLLLVGQIVADLSGEANNNKHETIKVPPMAETELYNEHSTPQKLTHIAALSAGFNEAVTRSFDGAF
ncbi:hypothetical protein D3C85_761990 [compost metagenome]